MKYKQRGFVDLTGWAFFLMLGFVMFAAVVLMLPLLWVFGNGAWLPWYFGGAAFVGVSIGLWLEITG